VAKIKEISVSKLVAKYHLFLHIIFACLQTIFKPVHKYSNFNYVNE